MNSIYQVLATFTVLIHFLFILTALFGGLLVLKWRKFFWVHLPVFIWGVLVEFGGWICPLTPLENYFRQKAGLQGYEGDFLLNYLDSIIYPDYLTRDIQFIFGGIVLMINLFVYGLLLYRLKRK